jgi:hypothetical protein
LAAIFKNRQTDLAWQERSKGKKVSAKEFPAKEFPAKEFPAKEFPAKEFPAKEFPAKHPCQASLPIHFCHSTTSTGASGRAFRKDLP